jgi:hypothetical protein
MTLIGVSVTRGVTSISFEKKIEEFFSPRLSSNFPSPQRDGALKVREREREKSIEKRKEKEKL